MVLFLILGNNCKKLILFCRIKNKFINNTKSENLLTKSMVKLLYKSRVRGGDTNAQTNNKNDI